MMADDLLAQLQAERAAQAASPQLQEPLAVPKTPALCGLLGLSPDLFSVRRADLVRKATDELAWSLSWYVLFTMTVSAAEAVYCKSKKQQEPAKVTFVPSNLTDDGSGRIVRQPRPNPLEVFADDEEILRESWNDYLNTFSRLDVRSLLNHVVKVNDPHLSTRFYDGDVVNIANRIREMIRFFFHRDGVVGEPFADDETGADRRNSDAADAFFGLLPSLLDCLSRSAIDHSCWQRQACDALEQAASRHFASTRSICQLYHVIFGPSAPAQCTTTEKLEFLLRQLDAGTLKDQQIWSQCLAFSFWTRFGTLHQEEEGFEEADNDLREDGGASVQGGARVQGGPKLLKPRGVKHMATVKVYRHQVTKEKPFVTVVTDFLADPMGVTHLDVYNRGLDVALLCLRRLLIDAVIAAERPGTSSKSAGYHIRIALLKLKENVKALVPGRSIQSAVVYKEVELGDGVSLAEDFRRRHSSKCNAGNLTSSLLRYDAHFADPRFLAVFFQNLHESQPGTFPDASFMTTILDRASHQYHLHHPAKLNRTDLAADMAQLQQLVEGVAKAVDLSCEQLTEYQALVELKDIFLPFYFRWRSRQRILVTKVQPDDLLAKAKASVTHLLTTVRQDARGELPPCQLRLLGAVDGSAEALRHILNMIGPRAAPSAPTSGQFQGTDLSSNPYFALLSQEGDENEPSDD